MKKVFNLLIVDESGSMSVIEKEALAGLNETLETVKKAQEKFPDMEQRVTLISFTSFHTHVIFENAPADKVHTLGAKDYRPGGGTPLYDAIGYGISKLNVLVEKGDRVLVTIITDGEENSSKEFNLKMVKNLIDKLKEEGWTFTLIGTDNLDVEGMAGGMGFGDHLSFCQDARGTERMFATEHRCRMEYYKSAAMGCEIADGHFFAPDSDPLAEKSKNSEKPESGH